MTGWKNGKLETGNDQDDLENFVTQDGRDRVASIICELVLEEKQAQEEMDSLSEERKEFEHRRNIKELNVGSNIKFKWEEE